MCVKGISKRVVRDRISSLGGRGWECPPHCARPCCRALPSGCTRETAPGALCGGGSGRILFGLAVGILVVLILGGCASAPPPPSRPLDACAIFAERPSWYRATKKAERKWGTPVYVQLAIIQAESSFRHDARPPGRVSSAYGYSQAIDGTWDWYRSQTGNRRAKRTNFEDAVDFVGWYTDVSQRTLRIPKADAYRQYLAYHEGHRGFERGTYRKKAWLMRVAQRVDKQAKTYRNQLNGCKR